jgi:succinate dehydrogenase/fumarate reductase flavoprotein subunit
MPENEIARFSEKAFHTDGVATRPITTAFWTRTIGKAMAAAKNPGPMQEVIPGFIGEQSPVRVDHQMATTLPGLYAVGDISAAGAAWAGAVPAPPGRMRGGGMMGAMWMAMRGGPAAGDFVTSIGDTDIRTADVQAMKDRLLAPLERKSGVEAPELVRAIQDVMSPVGNTIYKSKDRLAAALDKMMTIKAQLPELRAKDWHYLAACNEVASMVNSAEMFFRASLVRQESRGWHIREDYPGRDDENWLKWIILKDVGGDMRLSTEDVPIERYPLQP